MMCSDLVGEGASHGPEARATGGAAPYPLPRIPSPQHQISRPDWTGSAGSGPAGLRMGTRLIGRGHLGVLCQDSFPEQIFIRVRQIDGHGQPRQGVIRFS